MKHKSVKEALEYVARHPTPPAIPPLAMPIWELVARQLFEAAGHIGGNKNQMKVTNAASKIILDRVVGRRKTGTHPAVAQKQQVTIADFTKKPEVTRE